MKRIGVIRYPGTNCDRDVMKALAMVGAKADFIWHKDSFEPKDYSGFVIPGGFSFGDYLRSGALAARAKVTQGLKKANDLGMPILGICNGFQILCEANLLPGALLKNRGLRFVDRWVRLRTESNSGFFVRHLDHEMLLPVAHGDGCFYGSAETLKRIEDSGMIALRYRDNPNGSLQDIAGLQNAKGNVLGLMPHPERAMTQWMIGAERVSVASGSFHAWGRKFFEAFL